MTLLVKDANTAVQSLSTQVDAQSNLVPVHALAAVSGSVAVPVSASAPLPVINAAAAIADGANGTITAGGTAQTLFSGATPQNGFAVQNTSSADLWVNDLGAAGVNAGFLVPSLQTFTSISGYRPAGPLSIYGATTGQTFCARWW